MSGIWLHVLPVELAGDMTTRDMYLRGGKAFDQRLTAATLMRVADWLDIADTRTRTAVYPEMPTDPSGEDTALAWCWTAVLIASLGDTTTDQIRQLATGLRSMYDDETE